jgi:SAM-dependent methyltransferase
MLTACRACARPGPELLHASPLDQTLTSESKLLPGRLRIYLCPACAHVMSDGGGLEDVGAFYGQPSDSLLESTEADDLYELASDRQPIDRSHVQLDNLNRLANLPAKGRILDFGCGTGAFLARFQRQHPGWELRGCDVSYSPAGSYDLITMFFVAEHLVEPAATLSQLAALLAPGGLVYLTVPNVIVNTIDAFLVDHLSHFSTPSLTVLLHRCGLRPVVVSEHHHPGQITLVAEREPAFAERPLDRLGGDLALAYADLVRSGVARWAECGTRLLAFLDTRPASPGALAVYGAGVFGSFLALQAGDARDTITCFLDQNPPKTGTSHLGRPVVHPHVLPSDVTDILVGLNPGRARAILAQAGLSARPGLRFFFP